MTASNLRQIVPDSYLPQSYYWTRDWNKEILFWLNPPFHSIEQGTKLTLNTYQKKFAEPQLVTDGTYSLVRHPGVIWLFLAYFFLAIFNENSYLLVTAITWTFANTIYVIIQEKYVLVRLFPNYDEYIKTTPMVIPNYISMKKFITTKNWRKE